MGLAAASSLFLTEQIFVEAEDLPTVIHFIVLKGLIYAQE
jgi:hypothetical protein